MTESSTPVHIIPILEIEQDAPHATCSWSSSGPNEDIMGHSTSNDHTSDTAPGVVEPPKPAAPGAIVGDEIAPMLADPQVESGEVDQGVFGLHNDSVSIFKWQGINVTLPTGRKKTVKRLLVDIRGEARAGGLLSSCGQTPSSLCHRLLSPTCVADRDARCRTASRHHGTVRLGQNDAAQPTRPS
jgi:hypothetical protein